MKHCYICGRPACTTSMITVDISNTHKNVDMCYHCYDVHEQLKKRHEYEAYKELERIRGYRKLS